MWHTTDRFSLFTEQPRKLREHTCAGQDNRDSLKILVVFSSPRVLKVQRKASVVLLHTFFVSVQEILMVRGDDDDDDDDDDD